jgi:hypothetical protein
MMKLIYRSAAILLVIWVAKSFAEELKQRAATRQLNQRIDEMSLESFPSSDPPSSWAGSES